VTRHREEHERVASIRREVAVGEQEYRLSIGYWDRLGREIGLYRPCGDDERVPRPPDLRDRLRQSFRWLGDRTDPDFRADVTGWWRNPDMLSSLGSGLAQLFADAVPTVVLGTESRGSLLGVLTAQHLGIGFAEVRKDPGRAADSDAWWETSTGPDYRDRSLRLGLRRSLLEAGDKVLFVDDWIATGAQAEACHALVKMSGASWIGAAVVVDGLERTALRRTLQVRSLLSVREL
jgi:adenine phosphoribosyltransferase